MASNLQAYRVFSVVELLEAILLETELRTLLTSATRVCHLWHDVIETSPRLQAVLFFDPWEVKRKKPFKNPFIDSDIWPDFFRKYIGVDSPKLSDKLRAYLREDASWRRMLIHQPPTSNLSVLYRPSAQRVWPEGKVDSTHQTTCDHPFLLGTLAEFLKCRGFTVYPQPLLFCDGNWAVTGEFSNGTNPLYPDTSVEGGGPIKVGWVTYCGHGYAISTGAIFRG
ncbi:hypothetical protein ETB97_002018 [Aspergillus alliaceus]|uniref:F-box domain-containing protein n=1 Tax=Petromyces alliaceus TaxID=209559 RepID=A0A8H6A1E9_PETAA|nr:hypothetical protein ETB97_002018 [Aspergillus burnettii]